MIISAKILFNKNHLYLNIKKFKIMNKIAAIIGITLILTILLYPTSSNSNTSGSVGGKTGSPSDGASCTQCHYAGVGANSTIVSNVPLSGYIADEMYTITASIIGQSNKYGFELTSEESNLGSAKNGTFFITNSAETKLVNNNNAVTHKAAGTQGNGMRSWSVNWQAPSSGTGPITFYGGFIEGDGNGSNSGDIFHSTTLSINEGIVNEITNFKDNNILFNSSNSTIRQSNNKQFTVFNINGKVILKSNANLTQIDHLQNGTYIIKSENKIQKISISK